MKIAERYFDDDGKLIIQKTHDPNPVLDSVKLMREAPAQPLSESKHIGRIPGWMLTEWIKEAGISYSDGEAVKDLIRRKMLSGEFSQLRVWEGTY